MRLTLEGAPCIWAGAGFVVAADAALATPADFAPYLQAVPPELARHKDLLMTLGVCSDAVNVPINCARARLLEYMQCKQHSSPNCPRSLSPSIPLLKKLASLYYPKCVLRMLCNQI